MKLSKLAVDRPIFTIMVILIIMFLGFIGVRELGLDLYPDIEFPVVAVMTEYEGATPEEVENLVTRPIEDATSSVDGIEDVNSTSNPGQSFVINQFEFGTDLDFAQLDVREQIDMIRGVLPDDAEDPMIFTFDPQQLPIATYGFTGERDTLELTNWAEDNLEPRLERLPGIASVDVTGGLDREVHVDVDQDSLHGYGLTLTDLTEKLQSENVKRSGGDIEIGRKEMLTETDGEFDSVDEIRDLHLNDMGLQLSQVAEVIDGESETEQYARVDGVEGIGLSIQSESGANTVLAARRLQEEIADIEENLLADDMSLQNIYDESEFIVDAINNLARDAFIGGLMAVIVLYIFMRSIKTTLIVGLAMPISIVATFVLMYFGDLTFNLMSLGGLALGIGMLVDNAIVVIENIYRMRQNNVESRLAATRGSGEVASAITASTLTTASVFLPVVFIEGIASELFTELSMTVAFSLFASLLVALTLIPMMASRLMNGATSGGKRHLEKFDRVGGRVKNIYGRFINLALDYRFVVVGAVAVLFAASLLLFPRIGAEFMPDMDEGEIRVDIELPQGTVLSETRSVALDVEDYICEEIEEVDIVFSGIGMGAGQALIFGGGGASHEASIDVSLVGQAQRERETSEIAAEIRSFTEDIPRADISVTEVEGGAGGGGPGEGAPVELTVYGSDLELLEEITDELALVVEDVEGAVDVNTSMDEGSPEVAVDVDRNRSADLGVPASLIAQTVNTGVDGDVATMYRVDDDEHDVNVRLAEGGRESLNELRSLRVASENAGMVELRELANIYQTEGPVSIDRENRERTATVTADLHERDLGGVIEDIEAELDGVNIPEDYRVEITGEAEDMAEAFGDLGYAMILAIVLIYMIMAAQFESLLHPFTIMFTVPMAIIGVLAGLFLTGHSISIVSIIGMIMLIGIVVNNAIVLVDYVNILRSRGQTRREALVNAGKIRLRPIMMTALTTMLALTPLALGIGEGAEAQAPMGVVVIGGLFTATFLTLVFLPVVYSLIDGADDKIKGLIWN
ncbi:efflux RND transporter permease subunit [Halarsenatibacter silvermanii]|uniref:Hydrophobic/amphiphilic exporter-1, HAE1 family n=1 Tax=Halarsenatibacter silvermanii TaxID=321763 RepID=A0A1G9SJ88_9FIRM|nr:efflux RND transporter permease subunit [Halarsenatibacter silvermanii]SDM35471.1 hydrophobic/amphiphilic exporter-1, HAE1 family [Halarsenatibacter silvermanii]